MTYDRHVLFRAAEFDGCAATIKNINEAAACLKKGYLEVKDGSKLVMPKSAKEKYNREKNNSLDPYRVGCGSSFKYGKNRR